MKKYVLGAAALSLGLAGAAYAAGQAPAADPLGGGKTVTRAEYMAKGMAMFDKMDANHDGKIDAADRAARESAKFDRIDTNHDGSISRAEFAAPHMRGADGAGAKPKGEWKRGGERGERGGHMGMMMLRMADTNKDGVITRDEFAAAQAKHFDMIDTNHDGQITPEERQAAHAGMKGMRGQHRGKHGNMPMGDMPPPPPGN